MRFLRRGKKAKKIILVISDLHLGAGHNLGGRKNSLEDFHSDEELVEFLKYHSTGEYAGVEVELIINGDFLDLLAVPHVPYFDDEYWSESAALEKLELIICLNLLFGNNFAIRRGAFVNCLCGIYIHNNCLVFFGIIGEVSCILINFF